RAADRDGIPLRGSGVPVKSYDAGPTDTPILEQTIGANFEQTVRRNPDAEALVDVASGRRWTYSELNDEINVVAGGLMALGVEAGDRVGIWSPNCAEWTIAQYAAAKVGAILVNINPAYRLRELEYALQQSGVSILIAARRFRHTDYIAVLLELAPELAQPQASRPRFSRL